jgi:hypothetical protein
LSIVRFPPDLVKNLWPNIGREAAFVDPIEELGFHEPSPVLEHASASASV